MDDDMLGSDPLDAADPAAELPEGSPKKGAAPKTPKTLRAKPAPQAKPCLKCSHLRTRGSRWCQE
eukprot:3457276-Alexandrium_andersonii.AAC.1